ncbi:UPF0149 family protein [Cognatazoarcus halotolerans]|uniref:UPF0149 family protein n=1 Tax=Cognatazoarcus halotolerans TaxID=2686016 RepID=UPI00135CD1B7|nr:UPF0149 family protein [Cognatazoarcus halotolerans]MCB1902002.1 UPF0149 family protein [Rhodocyclaceae bacterium]MCP5309785.1 UPF0149 family protein [Zoogloeaceae bacterium]
MSTSTLTRPLSDTDRDELHAFLASRPGALDPEALDGLFCALIVGPETVAPGDWIPLALGESELVWDDEAQMRRILELLLREWNSIAGGFQVDWRDVPEPEMRDRMYLPSVDPTHEDPEHPLASRWAKGFGKGLAVFGDQAWEIIDGDEEALATASLIAALDHGRNDTGEVFDHASRKQLLAHVVVGLQHLYRLFRDETSHSGRSHAPYRAPPLPGRNDPCPCGSGLKFKKCCGAPERLH